MRAARWLVIGTALVAAAIAFHLLMSPGGGSRTGPRAWESASSGLPEAVGRLTGSDAASGALGASGAPAPGGPPLDEIDAESREAMRNFLRESAQAGKQEGK